MKTITEQNAETKTEISALIYAHKLDNFHSFTALVERMLDKYAQDSKEVKSICEICTDERCWQDSDGDIHCHKDMPKE